MPKHSNSNGAPGSDEHKVSPLVAKKRASAIFRIAAKKKNDEVRHAEAEAVAAQVAATAAPAEPTVSAQEKPQAPAAPTLVAIPITGALPLASEAITSSVVSSAANAQVVQQAATPAVSAAPAPAAPATPQKKEWSIFGAKPAPKPLAAPAKKTAAQNKEKATAGGQAGKGKFGQKKKSLMATLEALNNIGMGKLRSEFVENLAILLNSGLTVIDALKTIEMELRNKPMKKIVRKVIDEVESGIALWCAMDNQNFFSPYALALIRIGEEAGSLSKNMEYLAIQQEKDRSLKSKVQMAMIYPAIVLVLTAIITLGLAWFVLPQLVGILTTLNAELPLVTKIVIWVANFFRDHGSVAVPMIVVLGILLFLVCKFTALRGPTEQFIFMIPGIGPLARSATIARFGVILGSLLKAGVPLVESIRSMADVTDTVYYKRFYYQLADQIEVGESFVGAFKKIKGTSSLLPMSVQQLVGTGEKSGKMAEMLLRIADIYEKKAEEWAQKLPVVLEPMLLIFIGGLVGTIAFAIIVPIYSLVGSVGR